MTDGGSLFEKAERERDDAIAAGLRGTNPAFASYVSRIVCDMEKGSTFCADDLHFEIDKDPDAPTCRDRRSLGGIIRALKSAGIIGATGEYRQSVRRHCAPISLWKVL